MQNVIRVSVALLLSCVLVTGAGAQQFTMKVSSPTGFSFGIHCQVDLNDPRETSLVSWKPTPTSPVVTVV